MKKRFVILSARKLLSGCKDFEIIDSPNSAYMKKSLHIYAVCLFTNLSAGCNVKKVSLHHPNQLLRNQDHLLQIGTEVQAKKSRKPRECLDYYYYFLKIMGLTINNV